MLGRRCKPAHVRLARLFQARHAALVRAFRACGSGAVHKASVRDSRFRRPRVHTNVCDILRPAHLFVLFAATACRSGFIGGRCRDCCPCIAAEIVRCGGRCGWIGAGGCGWRCSRNGIARWHESASRCYRCRWGASVHAKLCSVSRILGEHPWGSVRDYDFCRSGAKPLAASNRVRAARTGCFMAAATASPSRSSEGRRRDG